MKIEDFEKAKRVHIVGIGGAGMSAIARLLVEMGYQVQGSDLKSSRYTVGLEQIGVKVSIGHRKENIEGADLVVYSTAIKEDNPELVQARALGIPVYHRSQALRFLTSKRRVIAVTGTHGKTTSTSMTAHALRRLGVDAGFLVGGEVNEIGSNASWGTAPFFVIEADESDRSFLLVSTEFALITNIENDHLENYGSMERLTKSFAEFIENVTSGCAYCADDPLLASLAVNHCRRSVSYGFSDQSDYAISSYHTNREGTRFTVVTPEGERIDAFIPLKGRHNALNATGVAALLSLAGYDPAAVLDALATFTGVARRFELKGSTGDIDIIDDYAHHPTEIAATLRAAREAGYKRIIAVFQPHRYSRVANLLDSFARAFVDADFIVATDIYSAGEDNIPGITGRLLFEKIAEKNNGKKLAYFPRLIDIPDYLKQRVKPGDGVIFLGAGDITTISTEFARMLNGETKNEET